MNQSFKKEKYVVLLSGGLDSVVNFYWAESQGEIVLALTFDYGQRAAEREIQASEFFCSELGVQHKVIRLTWLSEITKTALVNKSERLPTLKDLDDLEEGNTSAAKVWVPNRNGVFLNIAASFAESHGANFIVPGFNIEEAATFPDNSQKFIDASNGAFKLSTLAGVQVKCFTSNLNKRQMATKAQELGVNLDQVWSCYENGPSRCGKCESCLRFSRALGAS